MPPDYSRELEFALELARLGGEVALQHYQHSPERKRKGDGTWVTEADVGAEAAIRKRVAEVFPDHNVLGEEEGLARATGAQPVDGAPTWVVDPIDGTNNFMDGIPVWATLVALQHEGATVVGVAHAPALEETYDAASALGARMNGSAISIDPIDSLEQATVLHGGDHGFVDTDLEQLHHNLARRAFRARGFGDFWGHMLVSRGAAHVMVEPVLSVWDVAALIPIVTEAGGRLTHIDGSPWTDRGSALTTNGILHDTVVSLR
ncbi:MAG: inositol monophosphatase family protein [Actinomycetota bacterium]